MADKRQKLATHYVVRIEVKQVNRSGVIPYGETVPDETTIQRTVTEVCNSSMSAGDLKSALDKAQGVLDLLYPPPETQQP